MIVNRNLKNLVMIPMLILYVIKKFKERQSNWLELLNFKNLIKKAIAILSLLVLTSFCESNSNDPLAVNHYPKMSNGWVNGKIIKSDLHHCKC